MSSNLSDAQKKQEYYRDARFLDNYDQIWQSVDKCVFCDLNDKYIIYEENGIVLTITLYAYIDGHCMILPRRHIRSPKELTQLEWETIRKFEYIVNRTIKDEYGVKGVQVIHKDGATAQSTVEHHLHFHCIPFDAPDLIEINYRKLTYTPAENAQKYRNARKKILKNAAKFDKKYYQPQNLSVVCDAIIINDNDEILFQERHEDLKLSPDYIVLPGGHVNDINSSLENEIAREVHEETNVSIEPSKFELVSSKIDSVAFVKKSIPLKATYPELKKFIRNTYLVRASITIKPDFKALDDAVDIMWIALGNINDHPRVSQSTKDIIKNSLL